MARFSVFEKQEIVRKMVKETNCEMKGYKAINNLHIVRSDGENFMLDV